jgi:hypothetical protein
MPKQLLILKAAFWIAGLAFCLCGTVFIAWFADEFAAGLYTDALVSILRMLARLLIALFGVMLIFTALVIGSRRIWVWDVAMTSAALCVSTIVLTPLGIYALRVLMRREISQYYGRYR